MNELLPDLFAWTAYHEGIERDVSSYFVGGEAATLIDPKLPEGGLEAIEAIGRPQAIVLTNRHHLRDSERLAEAFGCPILCHEDGLHEFAGGGPSVTPFRFGDELRPGIEAMEVAAITPEETALHIEVGGGAMAFADGIIRYGGEIGFVPDVLLGDDPEAVKRGVRQSVRRLLELDFDTVLFAHGAPIARGGKAALERFVRE
jgi:glyoxylase-like metal-dependent hydrolase (beta-lactamase superfamily II)